MVQSYRIKQGSLHQQFLASISPVQMFGGGFANGKTAAMCIKALQVGIDYPGANILMARSTYPKLNDTFRKEFIKWCPKEWIESFPLSKGSDNICTLVNGTTFVFRYIAQQGGSSEGGSTSNLLSQTFDAAFVDQIEDPEILHDDFLHLLGRMRGTAVYDGDDPRMPRYGPGWIVLSCNPTRNWVYKKLVKPLQKYQKTGERTPELAWDKINDVPMMELYEGSTYENEDNLTAEFIARLETMYTGTMRTRFLMGGWAAFEGLVYPTWNDIEQQVSHDRMFRWYLQHMQVPNSKIEYIEGYDYGIAKPSCYLFGFVDRYGNAHVLDGFYEAEMPIHVQAQLIKEIRAAHFVSDDQLEGILSDPAIFKRTASQKKGVAGYTVAQQFSDYGVTMRMADNDVVNGVTRVQGFMTPDKLHRNPYTLDMGSSRFYINEELEFFDDEVTAYRWHVRTDGEQEDVPVKKDDHAMDTTKYMLCKRPTPTVLVGPSPVPRSGLALHMWMESEQPEHATPTRYR